MQKKSILSMPLRYWPAKDRTLWQHAHSREHLLDDDSMASRWRPATIANVEDAYGVYLSWLAADGLLDPDKPAVERVDKELIRAFVDDYALGRSENTVASTLRGVAYMLRAVAPPDGLAWLTRLAHRLSNRASPSRPKLPRMASVRELRALADRLMAKGQDLLKDSKRAGAIHYRDGLMVACLLARPLRLRNLAALRIGASFLPEGDGYHALFHKEETKKGVVIDFFYPAWLTEKLAFYLSDIRPLLLGGVQIEDEGWLWIGRRGKKMSENNISSRIGNVTMKHLERRVSPHLFRDIGATSIALSDPGHVGITKSVLSHATLSSSQRFYNQARSFAAVRKQGDLLASLRKGEES